MIVSTATGVPTVADLIRGDDAVHTAFKNLVAALDEIHTGPVTVEEAARGVVHLSSFRNLTIALLRMYETIRHTERQSAASVLVEVIARQQCSDDECIYVVADLCVRYPRHAVDLTQLLYQITHDRDLRGCFAVNDLTRDAYGYLVDDDEYGRIDQFRRFLPRYEPMLTEVQVKFVEVLLQDWEGSLTNAIETARLLRPPVREH
jgi:hypothetical protein